MQPPIPDWETSRVILVDPAIWKHYRRTACDLRPVYRELIKALITLGVEVMVLGKEQHPVDLWIRDWGFVGDHYFRFAPRYAKGLYGQIAIERARQHLDIATGQKRRHLPIVLDGGNFIHDGKVAILTEKVLLDNPEMTRFEIEQGINSLGFERVVFLPVEPEDVIGHADGIVRFLSPDVLLVNDYTGTHFRGYKRRLYSTLRRAKLHAELVPFPWFTTEEMNDGVWSAVGCYINFLQTMGGIVVPTFEHRLDERALEVLKALTSLPVRAVGATQLARQGGVFNCIALVW